MLTKDENGQYFYDNQRVLVRYIRGIDKNKKYKEFVLNRNPRYNDSTVAYEPYYIRKGYPGPVGVMIALVLDGEIKYGYSKANIGKGDTFNKSKALNIAFGRALQNNILPPFDDVPKTIIEELNYMQTRAEKYFQKS